MLRLLRGQAGWTQEDLAYRAARNAGSGAGVSVTTISELERRKHPSCQRVTAERLADAFGLTDPARDVFVAVARGQLPAAAMLAEGIWDALCEQASRRGRPAPPSGDRPPAVTSSPDHGPGESGQDQARLMLDARTAGEPGSMPWHSGNQAPATQNGTPAEPRLPAEPPLPAVLPQELPADVRGFIGRVAELDALLPAATDHEGGAPGAVLICAVLGRAGIGKTARAAATTGRGRGPAWRSDQCVFLVVPVPVVG
jgi:hypothetical protein